MVTKIRSNVPYGSGSYDIWEVRPVPSAIGGGPTQSAPFAAGSAAAMAANELGLDAFRADVGNGFVHLYVMSDAAGAEPPSTNLVSGTINLRPTPPVQPDTTPLETFSDQLPPGVPPPGIPSGPPPGAGQQTTEGNVLLEGLAALGKLLIGKSVKDWAKLPANSSPQTVLAAAQLEESDLQAIGGLLQGIPDAPGVYWVGKNADGWFVPLVGFLGLNYIPDLQIPEQLASLLVDVNRIAGNVDGPNLGKAQPTGTGTGTGQFMPAGDAIGELLGPGRAPVITQVRRCPGPYRLAQNGRCYHKRLLPSAFRLNREKKAIVSWRDAQNIRKGDQASERITKTALDRGYVRKKPAPRSRRKRT